MDIKKLYCRVDSEHLDEFVKLVSEQFGEHSALNTASLCRVRGCVEVILDGWAGSAGWYESEGYAEFTGTWSIYNNTLPLSELSDEQRGLLFNHWCNGGDIDYNNTIRWSSSECPEWGMHATYRAKQKSERELFIEAVSKALGCTDLPITKIGGELFDAGFKAPKVSYDTAFSDSKVSKVK